MKEVEAISFGIILGILFMVGLYMLISVLIEYGKSLSKKKGVKLK